MGRHGQFILLYAYHENSRDDHDDLENLNNRWDFPDTEVKCDDDLGVREIGGIPRRERSGGSCSDQQQARRIITGLEGTAFEVAQSPLSLLLGLLSSR